jgi:hypothetical protein
MSTKGIAVAVGLALLLYKIFGRKKTGEEEVEPIVTAIDPFGSAVDRQVAADKFIAAGGNPVAIQLPTGEVTTTEMLAQTLGLTTQVANEALAYYNRNTLDTSGWTPAQKEASMVRYDQNNPLYNLVINGVLW